LEFVLVVVFDGIDSDVAVIIDVSTEIELDVVIVVDFICFILMIVVVITVASVIIEMQEIMIIQFNFFPSVDAHLQTYISIIYCHLAY
jgi:hypothetical protein